MLFPSYNQCCRGGKIATGIDTLSEGHWGLSNTAETFIMWKSVKGNNQKEGKGKLVTFRAPSLVKSYVGTELRIQHFAVSFINKVIRFFRKPSLE